MEELQPKVKVFIIKDDAGIPRKMVSMNTKTGEILVEVKFKEPKLDPIVKLKTIANVVDAASGFVAAKEKFEKDIPKLVLVTLVLLGMIALLVWGH